MNISTLTRCATGRCCLFGRAWTQIMAPVHLLFLKQAPRSEKKVPFRSWKKEIWQVPLMWRLVRILLQYKYFNTVLCVAQPAACCCLFGWAWKQIMALSLLFLRQAGPSMWRLVFIYFGCEQYDEFCQFCLLIQSSFPVLAVQAWHTISTFPFQFPFIVLF